MARTIVYPSALETTTPAASVEQPGFGGPAVAAAKSVRSTDKAAPADTYAEKLVKYIPAETIAFFAPLASLSENRPAVLLAAAAVGVLATPAYLWKSARKLAKEDQPLVHNYVLSAIAFVIWALGTSKLGTLAGLDAVWSSFLMAVGVFLIPLADELLVGWTMRKQGRPK